MNLKRIVLAAFATAAIGMTGAAQAGAIPYANPGIQNPIVYSFTAATTGDITAYFFASTAGYTNELTLLINGVNTGIQGLNNHASPHGESLVLGHANAGDALVFEMINISPGGVGPWYSDVAMNYDHINHVYSTDFAGDSAIPAGTFIAFEDLPYGGDFNYDDETFVFANVTTTVPGNVPEPATLLLTALGLCALGLRSRRTQ